jgi:hypothetical protein
LLPPTAAVGDCVGAFTTHASGLTITQGASQQIVGTDGVTASGALGYLTTVQYGWIYLRCIVANTTWAVMGHEGALTFH